MLSATRQAGVISNTEWRAMARTAVHLAGTPCYLFLIGPVRDALAQLSPPLGPTRRHWLSLKTQPLKPLLEAWRDWGFGAEVVSAYELAAAISVGLPGERILVNGVAKHHWLHEFDLVRLKVHFDSLAEVRGLRDMARRLQWHIGLRCQVPNGRDPEDPRFLDQFGMTVDELRHAVRHLLDGGVQPLGLHFHLGGDVSSADEYAIAVRHVRTLCDDIGFEPTYLDIGGGLPVEGERRIGPNASTNPPFSLDRFNELVCSLGRCFPHLQEVWLENGRYLTGAAGALVTRVLDRKDRHDCAYLICDGGRINHARMAALHQHDILIDPPRVGPATVMTTVCGPTSAGVDKLGRWMLPASVEIGDTILWMNAGAYHIPLETRFSVGTAPVIWFDADHVPRVVRHRETADEWWGQWG